MEWFNKEIHPMLAVKGEPFSSDKYIYEVKWDGTRCISFVDLDNNKLRLQNRRLFEVSQRFPELDLHNFVSENAILDGEIIVMKEGLPSFKHLQQRAIDSKMRANILSRVMPATLFIFDVLYTQTEGWIMNQALMERKKILKEISTNTDRVVLLDHIEKDGELYFDKVVEMGLEGVMAKRKESHYYSGKRSDSWLKLKNLKTIDCVIVGWEEGKGWREPYFGSLITAVKDNSGFRYIGRVGTGFDTEFLEMFTPKLKEIETGEPVIRNYFPFTHYSI